MVYLTMQAPQTAAIKDLLLHELQAPLLACLSDSAEMNRELACSLLASALSGDESQVLHEGLFSPILNTLVRRIGRTPFRGGSPPRRSVPTRG